jgi:hypothetical protein
MDEEAAPLSNFVSGLSAVARPFTQGGGIQNTPVIRHLDPAAVVRNTAEGGIGALQALYPKAKEALAGAVDWATTPRPKPGPQFDMTAAEAHNQPTPFSMADGVTGGGSFRMPGVGDAPSSPTPTRPQVKGKGGQPPGQGPSPIPPSPGKIPSSGLSGLKLDQGLIDRAEGMINPVRPSFVSSRTNGQTGPSFGGVNAAALNRGAELEGQRLPLTASRGASYIPRPLDTSGVGRTINEAAGAYREGIGGDMRLGLSNDSLPSPFAPRPSVGGSLVSGAPSSSSGGTLPRSKKVKGKGGVDELEPLPGDDGEDDLAGLKPSPLNSPVRNQIRRDRERRG